MSVLVKETVDAPVAINGYHHPEVPAGFNAETVRAASAAKNEPEWMREQRLAAWQTFESLPWPKATDEDWRRTRLTGFELENYQPFVHAEPNHAPLSANLQYELDEMVCDH